MSRKNSVVFVSLMAMIAGCSSVAPGIQFSKSGNQAAGDADHPSTEIISITSALVRKEKELRDLQVADDLSSLFNGFILKLQNVNIINDTAFLKAIASALKKIVNLSNVFVL
jgi:hypothetical protein